MPCASGCLDICTFEWAPWARKLSDPRHMRPVASHPADDETFPAGRRAAPVVSEILLVKLALPGRGQPAGKVPVLAWSRIARVALCGKGPSAILAPFGLDQCACGLEQIAKDTTLHRYNALLNTQLRGRRPTVALRAACGMQHAGPGRRKSSLVLRRSSPRLTSC